MSTQLPKPEPRSPMVKNLTIAGVALAVLVYTANAVAGGVIGGVAYDLIKWAWEPISNSIKSDPLAWVFIVLLLLGLSTLAFSVWLTRRELRVVQSKAEETLRVTRGEVEGAHDLADTINKFDLFLLGLLSTFFASTQNLETGMKYLMKMALTLAVQSVKDVRRAGLFLPDVTGELSIQEHYGLPEESVKRTKGYGGQVPTGVQRGVTGKVFKERKLTIVHFVETKTGEWKADDDSYIYSNKELVNGKEVILPISYRSLVCIPLIKDGVQEPLGVVSFDSMNPQAFDSPETIGRLQALGDRFVAILLIYQNIKNVPGRVFTPSQGQQNP